MVVVAGYNESRSLSETESDSGRYYMSNSPGQLRSLVQPGDVNTIAILNDVRTVPGTPNMS